MPTLDAPDAQPLSRSRRSGADVAVVLVHSAADPVSVRTLDGVSAAAPGVDIDVVVVDLDGGDGTTPWAGRDGVRVIRSRRDVVGLAGARNVGAASVRAEVVAFVGGDVTLGEGSVARASEILDHDRSIAAVALAVEGLGRPTASFRGVRGRRTAPFGNGEVLYPYSAAMVVQLDAFRRIGEFDDRYDRFGEDLDFGWRAWLLGYRVVASSEAAAIVHRDPVVSPRLAEHLSTRNGLFTIYKNYDGSTLARALPAAMALATTTHAGPADDRDEAAIRRLDDFAAVIADLEHDRERIQSARTRTDLEILRLFHTALDPPQNDETIAARHAAIVEAFDLVPLFGARHHILVATPDVLTQRMAGPAIRAWQIATALSADHDVVLMTTSKVCEVSSPLFRVVAADGSDVDELEAWCDVAVVQGVVLDVAPALRSTHKILVVDIYDPMHLEQLELERDSDAGRRRDTVQMATRVLNEQMRRGDFFVCASAKQRDFWLGQLAGLGRINAFTYDEDETLDSLLAVVPFGLPDTPAEHTRPAMKGVVPGIAEDDEVILWGGGIYNWFDPVTLVRAVDRLRSRRPKVRLFFMGLRHPNPGVPEMRMAIETRRVARDLGLTDVHVFFNEGWVAYDDRQNYLLEADIGVSTHLDHVETAFSFRTRILDYIWAGLPIVATSGDALADLIEAQRLGIAVPPTDVDALEEALFRLLDDRELSDVCRKNVIAVRDDFTWSTVLSPLVEFCRSPRRAPDLANREMAETLGLGVLHAPPERWRNGRFADVRIAVHHLREGGLRRVLGKSRSRLSHRLAGRR